MSVIKQKIIMSMQTRRVNGEVYHSWNGWVNGSKTSIAVSIPCDENGSPIQYTSKDDQPLVYGRVNIMPAGMKKKNKDF